MIVLTMNFLVKNDSSHQRIIFMTKQKLKYPVTKRKKCFFLSEEPRTKFIQAKDIQAEPTFEDVSKCLQ